MEAIFFVYHIRLVIFIIVNIDYFYYVSSK